ncbi:MAG: preprotein translocase subunit SecG [Campylobacterota bacterium]|nr:preprotein translocase subunit SecG [Campylobacterota bacterium]
MTSILLITQIVLVVVLTIAVLLQKSSSIGLGAYSGSNESVFGAKGPGSFLAKVTFTLGFLFVVNTVALGYFYGQARNASVVDSVVETTDIAAPTVNPSAEATDIAAPNVDVAAPAEAETTK